MTRALRASASFPTWVIGPSLGPWLLAQWLTGLPGDIHRLTKVAASVPFQPQPGALCLLLALWVPPCVWVLMLSLVSRWLPSPRGRPGSAELLGEESQASVSVCGGGEGAVQAGCSVWASVWAPCFYISEVLLLILLLSEYSFYVITCFTDAFSSLISLRILITFFTVFSPLNFTYYLSVAVGLCCFSAKLASGSPGGPDGKESAYSAGDQGSIPGQGKDGPLQYACLENSMGRGAWWL